MRSGNFIMMQIQFTPPFKLQFVPSSEHTELRKIPCARLTEVCSCSSFNVLPIPACKHFFSAMCNAKDPSCEDQPTTSHIIQGRAMDDSHPFPE